MWYHLLREIIHWTAFGIISKWIQWIWSLNGCHQQPKLLIQWSVHVDVVIIAKWSTTFVDFIAVNTLILSWHGTRWLLSPVIVSTLVNSNLVWRERIWDWVFFWIMLCKDYSYTDCIATPVNDMLFNYCLEWPAYTVWKLFLEAVTRC